MYRHRWMRVIIALSVPRQLDALAVDEQLIERCSQQSLRQAPDEVDGYYVGSTPWDARSMMPLCKLFTKRHGL